MRTDIIRGNDLVLHLKENRSFETINQTDSMMGHVIPDASNGCAQFIGMEEKNSVSRAVFCRLLEGWAFSKSS